MSEKWRESDTTWQTFGQAERAQIITNPDGLRSVSTNRPRKKLDVIIVGAGMAGLVAAYELKKADLINSLLILEARQTVGGRIRTIREPFFSPGLYGEAGAMRIPEGHKLTLAYVSSSKERCGETLDLFPFAQTDDNAWCYINQIRKTWKQYAEAAKKGDDCFGFELGDNEKHYTIDALFKKTAVQPLHDAIERARNRDEALNQIMKELSTYSTRRYLQERIYPNWSPNAVRAFGLVENQQARLNNGVVALLREYLTGAFWSDKMYQIFGGMDLLPKSFLRELGDNIVFGARMEAFEEERKKVKITYQTPSGRHYVDRADFAIITLPFPMLRHMVFSDTTPPRRKKNIDRQKQAAIQSLNYSAAGKIMFQCKTRFWEKEGIFGGRTQTDLGVRTIWYPKRHPDRKQSERAVLLASYTWGRDSQRWTHLSERDRMQCAFSELSKIHPIIAKQPNLIEGGYSIMWQNDEFSGGAFALTNPYQEIHDEACRRPQGRIHFAGEHTSLNYHRWIEGAVESGLRAAWEIYQAS